MVDMKDLDLVIEGTLHNTETAVIDELKERINGGWACCIEGSNIKIYKDVTV